MTLRHISRDNPWVFNNCRVKTYPDGTQVFLVCSENIYNPQKLELEYDKPHIDFDVDDSVAVPGTVDSLAVDGRSLRRAKNKLKDYILCNDFSYFVTFTVADDNAIDREDYNSIIKPLSKWLDNRVQRKGLKYLFVAERHKKSNGIHFHGLTNDTLNLVDSGTVKVQGVKKPVKMSTYRRRYMGIPYHTVYNVTDWKYGFTTAIRLYGEVGAVANYVAKYLQKDLCKIGGRLYLHSNNLTEPVCDYMSVDFDAFDGKAFSFDGVPLAWKYLKINGNEQKNGDL